MSLPEVFLHLIPCPPPLEDGHKVYIDHIRSRNLSEHVNQAVFKRCELNIMYNEDLSKISPPTSASKEEDVATGSGLGPGEVAAILVSLVVLMLVLVLLAVIVLRRRRPYWRFHDVVDAVLRRGMHKGDSRKKTAQHGEYEAGATVNVTMVDIDSSANDSGTTGPDTEMKTTHNGGIHGTSMSRTSLDGSTISDMKDVIGGIDETDCCNKHVDLKPNDKNVDYDNKAYKETPKLQKADITH